MRHVKGSRRVQLTVWCMFCLFVAAILPACSAVTKNQSSAGWRLPAGDVGGTRFYPNAIRTPRRPATQADAWVVKWSVPAPCSAVFTGDVNGDSKLEIVSAAGGVVTIHDANSRKLGGFEVAGDNCNLISLADLAGDGRDSIFLTTLADNMVHIRAYDMNGKLLKTFAKPGEKDCGAQLFGVFDFNNDGKRKLVARMGSGYSGSLRGISVFDVATGKEDRHFRTGTGNGAVCVGDLSGKGRLQLLASSGSPANGMSGEDGANDSGSYVWCFQPTLEKVWRCGPFNAGGFFDSYAMLADVNDDGKAEIIVTPTSHGGADFQGTVGRVMLLDLADGSTVKGYDRDFGQPVRVAALLGSKAGTGKQIVVVREDRDQRAYLVAVLDVKPGFPTVAEFKTGTSPAPAVHAVSDLCGEGRPAIIVSVGPTLYALNPDLTVRWKWTRPDQPEAIINNVIVSDVNNDGVNELLVISGSPASPRLDLLGPAKR